MPTWSEYTNQIDTEIANVGRKDQATADAIVAFTKTSKKDNKYLNEVMQPAYQGLLKLGYSPDDATSLLLTAHNVRMAGDQDANDAFPGDKAIPMTHAAYEWLGKLKTQKPGDQQGSTDEIRAKLQAFADSMSAGIDPNDPTAQMIKRNTVNAAQSYGGKAGAYGKSGLGSLSAAGLYNNGMQAYDFQRKQLGLQAQGAVSNRDIQLGQLAQEWTKIQNGQADAQWAAKQNQQQALYGAIGTAGGAVVGGYLGGAEGAQAGMKYGGQAGAGLSGAFNGSGPSYQQTPGLGQYGGYKPPSGGGNGW